MKVLVISPWYPTDKNPNSGIFVKEQTNALIGKEVEPSVLFYNANLGYNVFNLLAKGTNKDLEIESNKIPVFYKNGLHFPLKVSYTRNLWIKQYLKLFNKYIAKFGKPVIIHAHTYWGGLIALKIKQKYNIPYLITEHSSGLISDSSKNTINKAIIAKAYNGSSCLIAVGTTLRSAMSNFTNKEINIIPNSINTSFFAPKNIRPQNKQITLSIIGGLIPIKQIHLAILSVNLLFKKGYNIFLNIIGGGVLFDDLNNLIKKLKAEEYIKLLGQKDRNEIKALLNTSNIYIHTSKFETFGVVLIEAMAMGLPVISTKSGGPESFVTNEVGILVKEQNPKNIANAIIEILENKDHYNSDKIRKYVIDNFSDDVISKKIIAVYNNILKK